MMRNIDRYGKSYLDLPFEAVVETFRRKFLLSFLRSHIVADRYSLLEIGAGRDTIVSSLPDSVTPTVLDVDPTFLDRARTRISNPNCSFVSSFFEEWNCESCFDVVLASSVLHEVPDDALFLTRVRKILASDGRLVLIVPNARSIHRLLGREMGVISELTDLSETNVEMQQFRVYTIESLSRVLEQTGFEIEHISGIIPKLLDHRTMQLELDLGTIDGRFLEQFNQLSTRLSAFCSELFVSARPSGELL